MYPWFLLSWACNSRLPFSALSDTPRDVLRNNRESLLFASSGLRCELKKFMQSWNEPHGISSINLDTMQFAICDAGSNRCRCTLFLLFLPREAP
jgi:hypothetical protein